MTNWGTIPDWLAGVGTVGTLAASVYVLGRDEAERAARSRFERSAQARAVTLSTSSLSGGAIQGGRNRFTASLAARNGSDEAIHDVSLVVWPAGDDVIFVSGNAQETFERPLLAAGDALPASVPIAVPASARPFGILAEFRFTDMAGQRWVRDPNHRLLPLSAPHRRWWHRFAPGRRSST